MPYLHPLESATFETDHATMQNLVEDLQGHNLQDSLHEAPELPIHHTLSARIDSVRGRILDAYRWNIPLLTEHVANPDSDPRAAQLLIHASTPRTVREMNQMTTEPEEQGARVAAVQDLLIKLGAVEIGQPFSYRNGSNRYEAYRIEGHAVQRPRMLEVSRYDELVVTTPFVQPDLARMYADGRVSFHRLAYRIAGDLSSFNLTIGDEAVRQNIHNTITTARQHDGGFGDVRNLLRNTHCQKIAESVSAEDFAWLEEQISRTYAVEDRGVNDSAEALTTMLRFGESGDGLAARAEKTKQLVLDHIAEKVAGITSLSEFHHACTEAARKLVALDALPTYKSVEELQLSRQASWADDDPALIANYRKIVARTQA